MSALTSIWLKGVLDKVRDVAGFFAPLALIAATMFAFIFVLGFIGVWVDGGFS